MDFLCIVEHWWFKSLGHSYSFLGLKNMLDMEAWQHLRSTTNGLKCLPVSQMPLSRDLGNWQSRNPGWYSAPYSEAKSCIYQYNANWICSSLLCVHGPRSLFQIATRHFTQSHFVILRLHLFNSGAYTRLKSIYPNIPGPPKAPWSKQAAQFQSKQTGGWLIELHSTCPQRNNRFTWRFTFYKSHFTFMSKNLFSGDAGGSDFTTLSFSISYTYQAGGLCHLLKWTIQILPPVSAFFRWMLQLYQLCFI